VPTRPIADLSDDELLLELAWAEALAEASPEDRERMMLAAFLADAGAGVPSA
jgi:hypothetical protein